MSSFLSPIEIGFRSTIFSLSLQFLLKQKANSLTTYMKDMNRIELCGTLAHHRIQILFSNASFSSAFAAAYIAF